MQTYQHIHHSLSLSLSLSLILDFLPVGFRFRPTNEELVNHYLKNKLLGNVSHVNNVIAEVDVCRFEPWELPSRSVIKSDDQEWFFLCPIEYKYAKSKRFKRTTNNGFWKATGNDRSIKIRGTNKIIGTKKTLVYHEDPVPGVKTNWIIHEYHDAIFDDHQRTFVLCRLMKKAEKNTEEELDTMICDVGESSRHMSSHYENQETLEGISNVSSTMPKIRMESIFEEPYQADKYFPFSTQQSSIYENEREVYFSNSQFQGDYFRNEDMVIQSPFETNEEENNFINSMIVDGAPTRQGKVYAIGLIKIYILLSLMVCLFQLMEEGKIIFKLPYLHSTFSKTTSKDGSNSYLYASDQTLLDKLTSTKFGYFINNKNLTFTLLKHLKTTPMEVTNFNSLASFLFQLQLIPSLLIDMKNTHCEAAVVVFIPKTRVVMNWTLRRRLKKQRETAERDGDGVDYHKRWCWSYLWIWDQWLEL
ncbi:NAC transcription factor-like protein [Medicago truncatula]|uniref:NAC transcription factor-like protein n=2 Tax=Medicago truncatula TaxID=3880 RepID=A0A072TYB6_MEDTR|nr:NAC transcription factor-like protein [Medicago truncatula]